MLIHFVGDEFLELELDLIPERLRLARDLGLSRMDLTNCKVFVSFRGQDLDRRDQRDYLVAKGRNTSSDAASQQLTLSDGELCPEQNK